MPNEKRISALRLRIFDNVNKQSLFSILLTLFVHACGILFLLHASYESGKTNPDNHSILTLIQIPLTKPPADAAIKELLETTPPKLNSIHINLLPPPDIEIKIDNDKNTDDTRNTFNDNKYESNTNGTVFDPRLREKLQGNRQTSQSNTQQNWTNAAGDEMVDLGNGNCFVSVKQINSNERGTTWAPTKCRKTQNETMIDNIDRDIEERRRNKNPK